MKVVIIADDLTGAMDAAAPFARRGLSTRVVGNVADINVAVGGDAEVLSINTCTRHLAPDRAAQITADCIARVACLRPGILFKKIDSTLRGNVAAETVAAIGASGRTNALVTPAMPAQGRILIGGHVYIRGVLLCNTAIGRDNLNAPPEEALDDILRAAKPGMPVRRVDADASFGQPGIDVVDCSEETDLRTIAASVLPIVDNTLLVGAGGLTEALADTAFGPAKPFLQPESEAGAVVFVVGSCTPEAARQVDRLVEAFADACIIVDVAPEMDLNEVILACATGMSVIIVRVAPQTVSDDANRVAHALGVATEEILRQIPTSLIAMTGGDTAIAVLTELGGTTIDVEGEVEAGIVHGSVDFNNRRLRVLAKAGAFGDDDLFVTIARYFGKKISNNKGQP